jgi:hypothetical protein
MSLINAEARGQKLSPFILRVFPTAVRQILQYEPESQFRSRRRVGLKESEGNFAGVIGVSSVTYNYFY